MRQASAVRAPTAAAPLLAALVAVAASHFIPLLGPLLIALVAGAIVANTRLADLPSVRGHAPSTKLLLRVGVVLIGLRLSLNQIGSIGLRGLVIVFLTVALTYWLTILAGRRLDLDPGLVTLVAAGFSICGAAAIAAVSDAVRARQRDVVLAVALVTVYGSAMIVAVPALATAVGLPDGQAAVWAGASIHEVAQVVASASLIGSGAVAVALTIKLGRVALLAPVYVVAARGGPPSDQKLPQVPWFLTGFALAVGVRSTGWVPDPALEVADLVTTVALAAGMFGLGLGLRAGELWPVPIRALWLATIATVVAGGLSLAMIAVFY